MKKTRKRESLLSQTVRGERDLVFLETQTQPLCMVIMIVAIMVKSAVEKAAARSVHEPIRPKQTKKKKERALIEFELIVFGFAL